MSPASLAIGILAGAIGLAYFIYGKRQARFAPLLAGLGLCVYPYFVDSVPWSLVIGAALTAAPFSSTSDAGVGGATPEMRVRDVFVGGNVPRRLTDREMHL